MCTSFIEYIFTNRSYVLIHSNNSDNLGQVRLLVGVLKCVGTGDLKVSDGNFAF